MAGISCPSCGGKMIFDIPGQNLKCPFCGTEKEIQDYTLENEAEEQGEMFDAVVYTCQNCGAELTAPDEQTVAYCSYCGSESMLSGKHESVLRPKHIIPFKKSKRQAKNAYEEALKGKLYVPKDFKEADFLESFRGIYLPYYAYEAEIGQKTLQFKGKKNYTRGGYDYKEEYDIEANIGGTAQIVRYDASASFDDTIANEIAPFKIQDERQYKDAYLAGFYADKATTPVATYINEATEETLTSVYDEISKKTGGVNVQNPTDMEQQKEQIGIDSFKCDVTMFPVWFLTWRNKNRLAYSVMNGQTGKISTEIPVDKKKFFLITLAGAALIFLILSLLPVFILPKTIMGLAAIILVISSILFSKELSRIYDKEKHVYDLGDRVHQEKKKRIRAKTTPREQQKKTSKLGGCAIVFFGYIGIYAVIMIVAIARTALKITSTPGINVVLLIAAFIVQAIFSFLIIKKSIRLDKKSAIIPAFLASLALAFSLVVAIANPAHDFWYYGGGLAALVALVINGLSSINYFNYMVTRPVPNFFSREGADHEA